MKKILFLSPLPPPHYGAAILSQNILNSLKKCNDLELENIKLNYSVSMKDVGHINLHKLRGIFIVKEQIKKKITRHFPDLIYFAPATFGLGLVRDYLFVRELKKFKIPIIFHIHSRLNRKNFFYNLLYKEMFRKNKVIVLGRELVIDVEGLFPKKNIYIIPNAIKNEISDTRFREIINEREKSKLIKVLFLSNMIESKGWYKLLQACRILKTDNFNFVCNFVGEFPSKNEQIKFESFVDLYHLKSNGNYLGKRVGKEKAEILSRSDIFVFPTEYPLETFGLVILEAMSFGIPVIANRIATIPSTVKDGETGYLLDKNTPEEIANKIKLFITNNGDIIKMGLSGRKRFLDIFEWKNYVKNLLKIFAS